MQWVLLQANQTQYIVTYNKRIVILTENFSVIIVITDSIVECQI